MQISILKSVFAVFVLALFGAGCWGEKNPAPASAPPASAPPVSAPPVSTPPETAPPTSTPPTVTPPASSSGYQIPPKDETWKTYTNNSLQFAFDWPTKGRYAPEWEVKFYKSDDANIQNGCFVGGEAMDPDARASFTVGEVTFCRTQGIGAAAGSQYHTHYYTAQINNTHVVVSFVKRSSTGSNYDDPRCNGKLVLSGPPSCIEFESALFIEQTEMIMRTFRRT